MATAKKTKGLVVVAPLVQVDLGGRPTQFRAGDVLPEGVSEESVEHLKALGYVAETEASAPAEPDEK